MINTSIQNKVDFDCGEKFIKFENADSISNFWMEIIFLF